MEIFVKSFKEMEEFKKKINENDAMQLPLVSICSITYNHAPYIRQCLDGFLMQKTNFKYEIIIHDDASTDGTAEIIKEYAEKYPDLITPIFQTENQYSKGLRGFYARFVYPRAKGKYIAICEGDDYWTDPLKLQKQVDFLEANPDFVMCSHTHKILYESLGELKNSWYRINKEDGVFYNIITLINGDWFFHPLTVVYRADKLDLKEYSQYPYSMDAVLFFHLLKKGKGYMFPEEMGVYRVHSGGIWSGVNNNIQLKNEFHARIGLYEVEQSYEAAFFLRHQFAKTISRKWMIKEWRLMTKSFKIISKHFGVFSTFKIYLRKLLLNKKLND